MILVRSVALAFCLSAMLAGGAGAVPAMEPLDHAVCRLIEGAAHADRSTPLGPTPVAKARAKRKGMRQDSRVILW